MSEDASSVPARTGSLNIMVLLAALIPVAFIMGFWVSGAIEAEPMPATEETMVVSMIIDYGDGNTTVVENITVENMTVYGLLVYCSDETIGNYTYASTYWSAFDSQLVETINGYTNDVDDKWWEYTVNGEYIMLGADKCWLEDGDIVEWIYKVPVWV